MWRGCGAPNLPSMASPRLALLLLPVLACAGCAIGDDGPRTSQTRSVASFTRVDSPDSVDVRLHVGGPQRVVVRAGEKVIDKVHTDVGDGTLHVRFPHHGFGGNNVVVEATVAHLTDVVSTGSGDVDADGVKADALTVRSDGSGDVSLEGATGSITVNLDGSGNADLAGLSAHDARVKVSGSGDADVRADRTLDVTIDGSGDVHYHGHPQVTEDDNGSGDVSHAA